MNKVNEHTIADSIVQVLKRHPNGLTTAEIYDKIVEQKLYQFRAKEPVGIVGHTIRKNCIGVNIPVSKNEKLFKAAGDGRYKLKD